ncbi:MAG: caspase family protein, partial [Bacteroidia bacterium]|nr:caspase family protein [Bacteroidia bacterium]
MNKVSIIAILFFSLGQTNALCQVSEGSSGTQTISIKKKDLNGTSSGDLNFNIKTIKIGNDSVRQKFNTDIVDKSPPVITLLSPEKKRGARFIEFDKQYTISGKLEDETGIHEVVVNNREAHVNENNEFWISLPLAYGDNIVEIIATDVHQNAAIETFTIERKASQKVLPTGVSNSSIAWVLPADANQSVGHEKYQLQACISTSEEIKQVNLYQNGWVIKTVYLSELDGIGKCQYMLTLDINLKLDLNNLNIEVVTTKGAFYAVRDIYYKPKHSTYHALIIAVEEYDDPKMPDLSEPVNDALKLNEVLTTKYCFDESNVTFLKNPTRADILTALHTLRLTLTEKDNLLIFFAGHGYYDEEQDNGFWLPRDANEKNSINWIPNT